MKFQRCLPFDSRYLSCNLTEHQRVCYVAYGNANSSVNGAARACGKHLPSMSAAIQRVQKKGAEKYGKLVWDEEVKEIVPQQLKILLFDIEYAPTSCYVYQFYRQNISENQVIEHGYMLSWSAMWYGDPEEEIIYEEARTRSQEKRLVKSLFKLLEKADVAVGHNLKRYDMKMTKGRGLVHGLPPLKQPRMVDTLLLCRREFRLPRNSLAAVAEMLGVAKKDSHKEYPGFTLFIECLKNTKSPAWDVLKDYNKQDVLVLKEIYEKLRGHDSQSPNLGLFKFDTRNVCPKCGSSELQPVAPIATNLQVYSGYRCNNCGGISRSRQTMIEKIHKKNILANAR